MRLPNAEKAVVDLDKIANYLLNPTHPDNGGKAEFFTQLGFSSDKAEILAAALKTSAVNEEVTSTTESPHGKKYVIVGRMQSPSGKTPLGAHPDTAPGAPVSDPAWSGNY